MKGQICVYLISILAGFFGSAFQPIVVKPNLRQQRLISYNPMKNVGKTSPIVFKRQSSSTSLYLSSKRDLKEQIMEQLPSKAVIEAVEQNNRVIASDVAAKAGVSLSKARQELTQLAALTQADLAVSNDGEIIYQFPSNIQGALTQNSAKYKALQTFRNVWPGIFWFVRVSFGVALLASLVAIFSTIFFIQTSSNSDDDDRRDSRGGGFGGGGLSWYFGPSPFDFFFYQPYGSYGYYGTGRDPEEMGFLESIFSYVFGDGDPNGQLEEKRLSLAANMIRNNKGAVTAEQLAPFVDDAPDPTNESNYVDESYVLPIVSALGGEPIVTDDGEIVYIFPELQTSASTSSASTSTFSKAANKEAIVLKRAGMSPRSTAGDIIRVLNYNGISTRGVVEKSELIDLLDDALGPMSDEEKDMYADDDPTVLQEREYKFSLATDLNKFLAGGLGFVNLGGALYLGNLLGQYAEYGVRLPSYFGTIQTLYPFLLGYAILFNVIPAVRNLYIQNQNEKIRQRNIRRKKWQSTLQNAISSGRSRIANKLKAASKMQTRLKQIGSGNDIIYDTRKPFEQTAMKKQQKDLEDFDKLLESEDSK